MKVIATWDDAAIEDLKLAELMAKYEIPTIFYWPFNLEKSVNVKSIKKFLTQKQCLEIAKKFEIGSHTITHNYLTKIPLKAASPEISDSRKKWQDLTGQGINSLCYPRGYSNQLIRMIAKNAGYKNARTTVVGRLDEGTDPYQTPTTVHVGIDRVEYKGICWQMFANKMLEEARKKDDAIFHLFGHSWEIERENDWKDLESLLKELK